MSSLAAAGPAAADELNEIVVTATRLEQPSDKVAASISVVAGDAVQTARQQLSLDESLGVVPGVFFQNRYNFAQDLRIAIRGFGARSNFGVRGIKIIVDGIPETLADGQSQVDSIDLAAVRQIEVLRGPASALYGNAAGGVINIAYEQSSEPYVQARFAVGEYGYAKQQVKAGGSIGIVNYDLGVSYLNIDGYRAHSEAENTQLSGRFFLRLSERSDLSLSLSTTDQPLSNDPGGVTQQDAAQTPRAARDRNVLFDAGEALEQQRVGIKYKHSLAGGELTARAYFLYRDFGNRLPFTGGGIVQFDRRYAGVGLSYENSLSLGSVEHRFVAGVDLDRQNDDRQRYDNNEGIQGALILNQIERVNSAGFFLQDALTLSERWQINLGLRHDSIEFDVDDRFLADGNQAGRRQLDDWSPSIGVLFAAGDRYSVFGNYATAFETPTTTEFARPDGSGGFNTELRPQKSSSIEFGLRGDLGDNSGYEIVAFSVDVDDELIPFEIAASPGRDFFANAGKSQRQGVELAFNTEPVEGLQIALAYTLSDFEFDEFVDDNGNDFSGNRIPGIPETFAYADVSYQHASGFFAGLDASYADELFADNGNSSIVDGATVANLRLGFRKAVGGLELEPFLGIINLTDTAFTANTRINAFGGRFFEAGPERNTYGGISLRYAFSD